MIATFTLNYLVLGDPHNVVHSVKIPKEESVSNLKKQIESEISNPPEYELVLWKVDHPISDKAKLEQLSSETVKIDEKGCIVGDEMDNPTCRIEEVFRVLPTAENIHIVVGTVSSKSGNLTSNRFAYAAGAAGVCLIAAPLVIPAAVSAVGFGSGGIAAGSWAAGFMASYGGIVEAGSICAIMQSIGAVGAISAGATTTATVAGATIVVGAASVLKDEIKSKGKAFYAMIPDAIKG